MPTFATANLSESDKHYWHRYTDFYEAAFRLLEARSPVRQILEFGVFHGASVAWLLERFPGARIVGADILETQPEWPRDERVQYRLVDQANRLSMRSMFGDLALQFDLVFDDGSHQLLHQANCLVESMPRIRSGGLYVLEDIHTAHPASGLVKKTPGPNSLNLLLALQHAHEGGEILSDDEVRALAGSCFSEKDVRDLEGLISEVSLYKRANLPRKCWSCGERKFDYANLKCACGMDLYKTDDSMTALAWRSG